MVTTITVSSTPEQSWQQQALAELEQALGHSLQLWTFSKDEGWSRPEGADATDGRDSVVESDDQLSKQLDSVVFNGEPHAFEQSPGRYQLIIPLGDDAAATTSVVTESPEILVGLVDLGRRYFGQQEELSRLREENNFFLKQVSDDFEELTFLRSIAERLGLGDSTQTFEQLVANSLPELGKSAHAEELHFVLNLEGQPEILASWSADDIEWQTFDVDVAHKLLHRYQRSDDDQPVIRNAFGETVEAEEFPGVRDFLIVPVGEDATRLGWFVAINRHAEQDETGEVPEWRLNQHEFGTSEASLLSTAAAMIASHSSNLALFQEREQLLVNMVRTLVYAIEAKDQYTCGHSERVALYAKRLAKEIGYSEKDCELLYLTGLLHDVGKIAINDAILNKPDRLTDEEFAEIQRHPDEGWLILQELEQLSYVLPGVLHHHERMDGKGYPDNLQGTDIPLDGRVLAVADAYDAMTSDRAYRTGMPHDKAMGILRDGAGTQWDAEAIAAFLAIEDEITTIRETYRPRERPNRKPTDATSTAS